MSFKRRVPSFRWFNNLVGFGLTLCVVGCGCGADQREGEAGQEAKTAEAVEGVKQREAAPEMPMPFWSVTDPKAPTLAEGAERFEVALHGAYLKGECPGEGKKEASAGLSVVLKGSIKNPLKEQAHRATLTGIAFFRFSEKVALARASGGAGFTQEVTSDKAWKPGEIRLFEVETRPLDAIYCDYDPKEAQMALNVSMETPLGERVDEVVFAQPLVWSQLGGVHVKGMARVLKSSKPTSSFAADLLKVNTKVEVLFISRDQALTRFTGGVGWVSMEDLGFFEEGLPAEVERGGDKARIETEEAVIEVLGISTAKKKAAVELKITNKEDKTLRCRTDAFVLQYSDRSKSTGVADEALKAACKEGLEVGAGVKGVVHFEVPTDNGRPILLGVKRGPAGVLGSL